MLRFKSIHVNKGGPGRHTENTYAIYDEFISFNKRCTTVQVGKKVSDNFPIFYIDKAYDNKKVHQKAYMFSRNPGTIFWLTIKQWHYDILSSKHPEYDFTVFFDFYLDAYDNISHLCYQTRKPWLSEGLNDPHKMKIR